MIAIGSDIAEYQLLGTEYTVDQANANDNRQAAIGAIQFLLLIAAAVLFIRWFKTAYENVERLGGERRFSPKWAIWGWFVPVLSLWRPKQLANDIARSGAGDEPSTLVNVWWGAFLLSTWASQVAFRLVFRADTPDELRRASVSYIVADSLDLVAALLAVLVVRAFTAKQVAAAAA